jgi:hypothetical protein
VTVKLTTWPLRFRGPRGVLLAGPGLWGPIRNGCAPAF